MSSGDGKIGPKIVPTVDSAPVVPDVSLPAGSKSDIVPTAASFSPAAYNGVCKKPSKNKIGCEALFVDPSSKTNPKDLSILPGYLSEAFWIDNFLPSFRSDAKFLIQLSDVKYNLSNLSDGAKDCLRKVLLDKLKKIAKRRLGRVDDVSYIPLPIIPLFEKRVSNPILAGSEREPVYHLTPKTPNRDMSILGANILSYGFGLSGDYYDKILNSAIKHLENCGEIDKGFLTGVETLIAGDFRIQLSDLVYGLDLSQSLRKKIDHLGYPVTKDVNAYGWMIKVESVMDDIKDAITNEGLERTFREFYSGYHKKYFSGDDLGLTGDLRKDFADYIFETKPPMLVKLFYKKDRDGRDYDDKSREAFMLLLMD